MKKFYVYVHVCPNEKRYVGCTAKRKPELRWGKNGESYQYNKCFYFDILKFGWDNITHEVLEVESEEEMYRKEIELISFYHSNDPRYGYNNSVGGKYGHLGCKCSEETRKRISETLKGKSHSEETRKKMSLAKKGKPHGPHSEETRKKMSEAQKNRPRIKISLPDGTVLEMSKQNLARNYILKGKKFEYLP